jgi:glutathione S-transferase
MPVSENADIVLYYAPQSRAFRMLWFLEELGRPYRLEHVDLNKGDHKRPYFLAINPMGKVPTLIDQGIPIAETGAMLVHLADKYSPGELAPLFKEPKRADYLKWLFFAAGVMEPAFGEKFFKWQDVPPRRAAWGSFASMEETVTAGVQPGPWLTGDHFTGADVFVGSNLHWGVLWDLFPKEGVIADYVARCAARPALKRALQMEEGFIKAKQAEAPA